MKKKSTTQLKFILSDLVNSKQQQQQQQQLDNLKKKCLKSLNRLRRRNCLRKRLAEIYTQAKLVNKYRISQLDNVNMMFEIANTDNNNEEFHHHHHVATTTNCDGCCKFNSNELLLQQYHKLKEFCKNLLHRYKLISEQMCGSYDEFNAQFTNDLMLMPQQIVSSSSSSSTTTTTTTTTSTTYKAIHDTNNNNNNNYNYNKSFECSNSDTSNNKNDDNTSISVNKQLVFDDIPIHPPKQQPQSAITEPTTPVPKPNPYYELENRPIRTNYDAKNPIAIFVAKKTPSHKQSESRKSAVAATNQSNLVKTSSSINSSNSDVTIMQVSTTSLNVDSSTALSTSGSDTVDAKCEIVKQNSEESLVNAIAVEPPPPPPPPVEIIEKKEIEKVEVKIEEPTSSSKQQDTEMVTIIEPVVQKSSHQVASVVVDIPTKKSSTRSQPEKKDDVPVVKGVKKTSKLKEPIHKSTTEVHVSVDTVTTATTSTAMSPTISTTTKAAKAKSESTSIPQSTAKPSKLPRFNTPTTTTTTHKHHKEDTTHASPSSLNTSSSSVTKLKEKPKDAASTTSTSSISGKQQKTQIKRNEVREPEHHEGRPKRVKKPVDYKEKSVSGKLRRDTTAK